MTTETVPAEAELPLGLLSSFLFFLARRPVSQSNTHYLVSRLDGIKSLIPVLRQLTLPRALAETLTEIERTSPSMFARRVRGLQLRLLTVARGDLEVPADFVVTDRPPSDALANLDKVRIVFGPSIGIGDEIICFPTPRWFQRAGVPDIEVITTYPQIWQRVAHVTKVTGYRQHRELLEVLRTPASDRELLVLIDFEKPGLSPMLAREGLLQRYLEIALGAESAIYVDQRDRSTRSLRMPVDRLLNYYAGLEYIARWFGLRPDPRDRFGHGLLHGRPQRSAEALTLFVSPFTSKHDPAGAFWAQLIVELFDRPPETPVRVRIDAGANRETSQLSRTIAQSCSVRAPRNVSVEVASGAEGLAPLTLKGVFEELDAAHAVICTDSFIAHAAPLFGCTTMVLAGPELSNWRVPAPASFYLDATERLSRLVAALRCVLERVHPIGQAVTRPPRAVINALDELRCASQQVESSLFEQHRLNWADYEQFLACYELGTDGLQQWPLEFEALLGDMDYQRPFRRTRHGLPEDELHEHLRVEVGRWVNSNLRKLLNLPLLPVAAGAPR